MTLDEALAQQEQQSAPKFASLDEAVAAHNPESVPADISKMKGPGEAPTLHWPSESLATDLPADRYGRMGVGLAQMAQRKPSIMERLFIGGLKAAPSIMAAEIGAQSG